MDKYIYPKEKTWNTKVPQSAYLLWITEMEASEFKALHSFVKTLPNWQQQSLNYFVGCHNHGFAESVDLKINMLNRHGYGYHNFNPIRLHVYLLPTNYGRAVLMNLCSTLLTSEQLQNALIYQYI